MDDDNFPKMEELSEEDKKMARLMIEMDLGHDSAAYASRLLDDEGNEIETTDER